MARSSLVMRENCKFRYLFIPYGLEHMLEFQPPFSSGSYIHMSLSVAGKTSSFRIIRSGCKQTHHAPFMCGGVRSKVEILAIAHAQWQFGGYLDHVIPMRSNLCQRNTRISSKYIITQISIHLSKGILSHQRQRESMEPIALPLSTLVTPYTPDFNVTTNKYWNINVQEMVISLHVVYNNVQTSSHQPDHQLWVLTTVKDASTSQMRVPHLNAGR